jgi:hypothetical protein
VVSDRVDIASSPTATYLIGTGGRRIYLGRSRAEMIIQGSQDRHEDRIWVTTPSRFKRQAHLKSHKEADGGRE